ncbi:putative oxidoreductase [Soonwooa buanensis]|uniref:Putative oxidoreductase n=1 Tax=Soonwooa buanensis TaxID=619805 RepID=A0A1T5FCG2_9FLAO|nr:DoxX family protein [Soonwooa buanensis]SKB93850.1 putative oxidoreductase [Soonwooa buanensis]
MKTSLLKLFSTEINPRIQDVTLLAFRVLLSGELIYAHGLKKLGVGVGEAEVVPNPLNLPEAFNSLFADAASLIFPLFVIAGLATRIAVLPILAVTLTGYFVLHFHDAPLIKDTPFMYSLSYLVILFLGPGKYSLDYFIQKNK